MVALGVRDRCAGFVFQVGKASDHPFATGTDLQAAVTVGVTDHEAGCCHLISDGPGSFGGADLEATTLEDCVV